MKYLLQPIPKENPYLKREETSSYRLLEETQQLHSNDHFTDFYFHPEIKIFCESCNKDITHYPRINLNIQQFCPPCFSQLQSFSSSYTVQPKLNFAIIQPAWSAYQQLLLLKSIEKWGFGNWKVIRDYMEYFGAKFTQKQIERHYNMYFLHEETYKPIFSQALIEGKIEDKKKYNSSNEGFRSLAIDLNEQKKLLNQKLEEIFDLNKQLIVIRQTRYLTPESSQIIPPYNSLRKQFDSDFDPNAQKSLVNLQFREDDLPEERQVKFKIIEDYNQRLKKRYEVQDFIIQHKLLDKRFQKDQQEERSFYQKQAAGQLKRLMNFNSFDEHNELVRRVGFQKQLKSLIEGLRSLRKPSNSRKLKKIIEIIKKRSISVSKQKEGAKPRKMIHSDSENNKLSQSTDQDELLKRPHINRKDLKQILKQAESESNGQSFMYKGVEVSVIEKK